MAGDGEVHTGFKGRNDHVPREILPAGSSAAPTGGAALFGFQLCQE